MLSWLQQKEGRIKQISLRLKNAKGPVKYKKLIGHAYTRKCVHVSQRTAMEKKAAHAALARPYRVFLIHKTWLRSKSHTKQSSFKRGVQVERQQGYLDANVSFFLTSSKQFMLCFDAILVEYWKQTNKKTLLPCISILCTGGKLERKFILVVISREILVIICNFTSSIILYLLLFHQSSFFFKKYTIIKTSYVISLMCNWNH